MPQVTSPMWWAPRHEWCESCLHEWVDQKNLALPSALVASLPKKFGSDLCLGVSRATDLRNSEGGSLDYAGLRPTSRCPVPRGCRDRGKLGCSFSAVLKISKRGSHLGKHLIPAGWLMSALLCPIHWGNLLAPLHTQNSLKMITLICQLSWQ